MKRSEASRGGLAGNADRRVVNKPIWPYLVMLVLVGCAGDSRRYHKGDGPGLPIDVRTIAEVVPRKEPRSRYGNPPSYVVAGQRYHVMASNVGYAASGKASWYGRKFHGRRTSSGEPFNMYAMTAAHKTLPLPTYLMVTNRRNGRQAVVKVNDRGPFVDDRLIDLSYAAAAKLGILANGTGDVEVRALQGGESVPAAAAAAPSGLEGDEVFVQLGAFQHRANAETLRARVSGADVRSATVSRASTTRGAVYRVRVGPLDSESEVRAVVARLKRAGIANYRLVTE